MMTIARRAISAYIQTEIDTAIPEADGHRLVAMLFDGALTAVADARTRMLCGDIPGRGQAISKAIAIIDEGLRASLDREQGGEIAYRLEDLYQYITGRLMTANLRSDATALDESANLLHELRSGWNGIARAQRALRAVEQEARI